MATGTATRTAEMDLHQVQAEFVDCDEVISGFVGGRGAGKTTVGAYKMLLKAKPDRTYAVIAPTYPMLRDASMEAFMSLGRDRFDYVRGYTSSDGVARLGNGARVLFRSADNPERLRGPNLSGVWLDEASQMKREAFEIVMGCLREGGEQGHLMATFTPNGRSHWTYDLFVKSGTATLFRASTLDNPFLPPDFHDTLKVQYSGLRAKQELEGEFVDIEGAEWPSEFFSDDIWFDEWPEKWRCKTAALDPSKGVGSKYGDYSAFVWLMVGLDGRMYIDADLANDRHTGILVDTAIQLQRTFQPDVFAFEVNQFQSLLAENVLTAARGAALHVPIWPVDNRMNKEVRIRRLTPWLSQGVLRFKGGSPGSELLVNQMRDFPLADHDDGPDALDMAVQAIGKLGRPTDGLGSNLLQAIGSRA